MKLFGKDYQGLIFDLDGTLLDSMQVWIEIDRLYLKLHNIEYKEEYTQKIKTLTFEGSAQYFIDEFHLDKTKEMIMDEWRAMAADAYFDTIPLKPYVRECLEILKDHVPLMIATSCETHFAKAALSRLGVLDYFQMILSTKDLQVNKETPDIFYICAKLMALPANECMVFEDLHTAIKCASDAGFDVCGVYDESSKADETLNCQQAFAYIHSFQELYEQIKP